MGQQLAADLIPKIDAGTVGGGDCRIRQGRRQLAEVAGKALALGIQRHWPTPTVRRDLTIAAMACDDCPPLGCRHEPVKREAGVSPALPPQR
jgi:hypothetical protein